MKTYKVVFTYPKKVITRTVEAADLDALYRIVAKRWPFGRMLGPSAIQQIE